MTEFRKAGLRTYYRVSDKDIIMVRNMHSRSVVDVSNGNMVIECDALDRTEVITEEEFTQAYNEALERIKMMRV